MNQQLLVIKVSFLHQKILSQKHSIKIIRQQRENFNKTLALTLKKLMKTK